MLSESYFDLVERFNQEVGTMQRLYLLVVVQLWNLEKLVTQIENLVLNLERLQLAHFKQLENHCVGEGIEFDLLLKLLTILIFNMPSLLLAIYQFD